jgi:hypothetical protein
MILKGWFMDAGALVQVRPGNVQDLRLGAKDAVHHENSELHNKNQELWEVILFMFFKKNYLPPGAWPHWIRARLPARSKLPAKIFFYLILQSNPEKDNSLLEKCA